MLKSHKDLGRWYSPLEPDDESPSVVADASPVEVPPSAEDLYPRHPDLSAAAPDSTGMDSAGVDSTGSQPESEPAAPVRMTDAPPVAASVRPVAQPSRITDGPRPGYVGDWGKWMDVESEPTVGRPFGQLPTGMVEDSAGAEEPAPRRLRAIRVPRSFLIMTAVAAAVLVVVVGIGAMILAGGSSGSAPVSHVARNSSGVPGCVDQNTGSLVTGAGPGGTASGPDAILWYQHSYYVERSGARAWQVVDPSAAADMTSAKRIQQGIDEIPVGTQYCVQITPIADGRYSVGVTQVSPGVSPTGYKEIVTTRETNGRTVITGIEDTG